VLIRPIRPDDEPLMVKFHGTLSDRTVYLRYFTSLSYSRRTAHDRLLRICTIDYQQEMVLVAEHKDPQTTEPEILGVGRLNRLTERNEAEVAVLISDKYQHQGLGTELVRRLIQIAREQKIASLVGEILRDNLAMQKMLKSLGFRLHSIDDPGSLEAVLEL